jgi:hypothetical protein
MCSPNLVVLDLSHYLGILVPRSTDNVGFANNDTCSSYRSIGGGGPSRSDGRPLGLSSSGNRPIMVGGGRA